MNANDKSGMWPMSFTCNAEVHFCNLICIGSGSEVDPTVDYRQRYQEQREPVSGELLSPRAIELVPRRGSGPLTSNRPPFRNPHPSSSREREKARLEARSMVRRPALASTSSKISSNRMNRAFYMYIWPVLGWPPRHHPRRRRASKEMNKFRFRPR